MKIYLNNCFHALMIAGLLIALPMTLSACADEKLQRPDVIKPIMPDSGPEGEEGTIKLADIQQTVAFTAGADGVNSYRIPAIITAKDGSLLAFGEARYASWKDRIHTDVVAKRSTDGGLTWSSMSHLTKAVNGGLYAFTDPCPVMDESTGRIWLFCCRWKAGGADPLSNRAFAISSDDNGLTWNTPEDLTSQIIVPGYYSWGYGPGAGFQIAEGRYKDRLIMPTRQYNGTSNACVTVYSDDHGATWKAGTPATFGGEAQIADCGGDILTFNIRKGGGRSVASSRDGGVTWSNATADLALPGPGKGCQASVLGVGEMMVFFSGSQGGTATASYDDRSKLVLYRSLTSAISWTKNKVLYDKSTGYSCLTQLNDGRLAIIFEAGDGEGFIYAQSRPAGWMRLDVIVLPKEVTQRGYWFE